MHRHFVQCWYYGYTITTRLLKSCCENGILLVCKVDVRLWEKQSISYIPASVNIENKSELWFWQSWKWICLGINKTLWTTEMHGTQPEYVIISDICLFQRFWKRNLLSATMSDAWEEIQAIKSKRNSLREKLQKRKKERQDILNQSGGALASGF